MYLAQRILDTALYKGNPPIDDALVHFTGGKQGAKYLDSCTNLAAASPIPVHRISSIGFKVQYSKHRTMADIIT